MGFFGTQFQVDKKVGVISGASQGLGLALAKQLFAKGASLIIISRSETKLKNAKKQILSCTKVHEDQFVEYLAADLIDYQAASKIIPLLDRLGVDKPDFLFCCAGAAHPQYFLNMTNKDLDFGMDTNYKTCVNLVELLAKRMIDTTPPEDGGILSDLKITAGIGNNRPIRHIALFSSEVAFYNFLGYAEYGPAKAAIKAFGDSIRHELKPYCVKVHVVFPGNFESEGYEVENRLKPAACKDIEGSSKPISVDRCAELVIKGIDHGELYIHTDLIGWVLNSFSLGFNPRNWGLFQVIVALVGAIVGGLIDFFHQVLIQGYFRKEGGFIRNNNIKQDENKSD
ncbi:DEKNAAC100507 [Brettanomyces naardenensis]|uniref:3-ketodihydrosphingosine reductase TSC10 n=1 Tax=Brettanomyces naardenensis TaxID=13370 RepID=A0A448YFR7_BRENA|nr:DEKNAAC100507 [Brettanomyces naardenensis]